MQDPRKLRSYVCSAGQLPPAAPRLVRSVGNACCPLLSFPAIFLSLRKSIRMAEDALKKRVTDDFVAKREQALKERLASVDELRIREPEGEATFLRAVTEVSS